MQQLTIAAITVITIMNNPRVNNTREIFHRVGNTEESVARPSIAKTAQLRCPLRRVHLLNTPTEGTIVLFPEHNKIHIKFQSIII